MKPMAKFGGATGNFHTLNLSDVNINWVTKTNKFLVLISKLSKILSLLRLNLMMELLKISHCIQRINNILIDLNQDMWIYIPMNL